MKKKIRATFSVSENKVNFLLPTSWGELSQKELAVVFRRKARHQEPAKATLSIFMHLTGLRVLDKRDGNWECLVPIEGGRLHFLLSPLDVPAIVDNLSWLEESGSHPVRLDRLHGATALPAMLHGVDFGTYLRCENLYQGVLQSQSDVALQSLAALLYPGLRKPLREWEQLMVLQWWSQIKEMFSGLFPHFFKPASGEDGGGVDMADVMNSQIRALTGGDVTKESEILALDTWRALTELDAKAREAEEFKRKIKKK